VALHFSKTRFSLENKNLNLDLILKYSCDDDNDDDDDDDDVLTYRLLSFISIDEHQMLLHLLLHFIFLSHLSINTTIFREDTEFEKTSNVCVSFSG
jgi:hypothetical protein